MPWADERWPGGRVWVEKDGGKTYWIRRRVNGRRFEVSTRATTLRGAVAQLERFEKDPAAYLPGGQDGDKLTLSLALQDAFLAWSEHEKKNTREWVRKQRAYLKWWAEALDRVDLRHCTLRDHILPILAGAQARGRRIAVLKAFFSYLRKERHLLTLDHDPTLDLKVPQARPEQWKRPKAIPDADYQKVAAVVGAEHRDLLTILHATGIHVTELGRFAAEGSVATLLAGRTDGATKVLIIPRRKGGDVGRVAVSAEVAAVAERVRGRGAFSEAGLYKAVREACADSGVTPFGPGQFRHTLATRSIEAGADPAAVAAFLGHKSPATTRKFYATLATVPRPVGA